MEIYGGGAGSDSVIVNEPLFYVPFAKQGESSISTVASLLADQPKQYVDGSAEVRPFTTYEYRIIATTAVGNGYSDWNDITTRPSSK